MSLKVSKFGKKEKPSAARNANRGSKVKRNKRTEGLNHRGIAGEDLVVTEPLARALNRAGTHAPAAAAGAPVHVHGPENTIIEINGLLASFLYNLIIYEYRLLWVSIITNLTASSSIGL